MEPSERLRPKTLPEVDRFLGAVFGGGPNRLAFEARRTVLDRVRPAVLLERVREVAILRISLKGLIFIAIMRGPAFKGNLKVERKDLWGNNPGSKADSGPPGF